MSALHIAHVRLTDGRVEDVDCDAAHVNDAGQLALTVNTYIGAIACYAPGTWSSYQLEFPPRPEQPALPCEGCLVHYRRRGSYGCVIGYVVDVEDDLVAIETNNNQDPGWRQRITRAHDETGQLDGSWHWPRDHCHHATAATPEMVTQEQLAAPITINVTVEGSVLSERKLQDVIASQIGRIAAMRGLRF